MRFKILAGLLTAAALCVTSVSYVEAADNIFYNEYGTFDTAEFATPYRIAYWKYSEAMCAKDAAARNEALAEAIAHISKAAVLAPDNHKVQLLASQIYRAKGGISYAKRYYKNAMQAAAKKIKADAQNSDLYLQAAIIWYAGYDKNWKEFKDKPHDAQILTQKALLLMGNEEDKKYTEEENIDFLLKSLCAWIVLDNEKNMEIAAQDAFSLDYDSNQLTIARTHYELAAKGEWEWPVADKEAALKEFLLDWLWMQATDDFSHPTQQLNNLAENNALNQNQSTSFFHIDKSK